MSSRDRYLMSLMQVGKAEAITVDAVAYAAGMEVNDSDHKPVWARLLVNLPVTMQDKKRRKCSHLLKDCFLHSVPEPPQVLITPELITLHAVSTLSFLHLQVCLSGRYHCCHVGRQHDDAVPHQFGVASFGHTCYKHSYTSSQPKPQACLWNGASCDEHHAGGKDRLVLVTG